MATSLASDAELDEAFVAAAVPFWHPVARSEDLTSEPMPVTLLGLDLVLWRDADGNVGCVEDQCPHRGTRLSDGWIDRAGSLHCPYHSWGFGAGGACLHIPQAPRLPIPSSCDASGHRVDEHAGLVWACLVPAEVERRPRPTFAEAESDEWFRYVGPPMVWQCQAARQIENFCDVAHFSVLHIDTFGNPEAIAMDPYEVDRSDAPWALRFTYRYCAADPTAVPDPSGRRPVFPIDFVYRVELPFSVWLEGAHGPGSALMVATSPVSPTVSRLFWLSVFHSREPVDTEALLAIEDKIWEPDRRIVESQRPVRLLAAGAEAQMPFDRLAVAYRRALVELAFGAPS